jgi:hypothetical protein
MAKSTSARRPNSTSTGCCRDSLTGRCRAPADPEAWDRPAPLWHKHRDGSPRAAPPTAEPLRDVAAASATPGPCMAPTFRLSVTQLPSARLTPRRRTRLLRGPGRGGLGRPVQPRASVAEAGAGGRGSNVWLDLRRSGRLPTHEILVQKVRSCATVERYREMRAGGQLGAEFDEPQDPKTRRPYSLHICLASTLLLNSSQLDNLPCSNFPSRPAEPILARNPLSRAFPQRSPSASRFVKWLSTASA